MSTPNRYEAWVQYAECLHVTISSHVVFTTIAALFRDNGDEVGCENKVDKWVMSCCHLVTHEFKQFCWTITAIDELNYFFCCIRMEQALTGQTTWITQIYMQEPEAAAFLIRSYFCIMTNPKFLLAIWTTITEHLCSLLKVLQRSWNRSWCLKLVPWDAAERFSRELAPKCGIHFWLVEGYIRCADTIDAMWVNLEAEEWQEPDAHFKMLFILNSQRFKTTCCLHGFRLL